MRMSVRLLKRIVTAACLAVVLLLSGCGGSPEVLDNPAGGLFSSKPGKKDNASQGGSTDYDADLYNVTAPLSYDPLNERRMKIEDGVVTISGKAGDMGITEVLTDFPADIDFKRSGDSFTCTVKCTSSKSGYGLIEIVNYRYHSNSFRVKYGENGISLPNVTEIARNNQKLAQGEIPETENAATVLYITASGDKERAAEVLAEVKELSDKICRGLDNDYDRLRAISRWVSENIYYDHPAFDAGIPRKCLSLEYILENRSGVCGSYANFTAALCQAQGIICYNVNGEGVTGRRSYAEVKTGEAHEWNYAFVGGRGIWVDSGWNSFNHVYAYGEPISDEISCRYFDIGNTILAIDHKVYSLSNRDFFDPDLLVSRLG